MPSLTGHKILLGLMHLCWKNWRATDSSQTCQETDDLSVNEFGTRCLGQFKGSDSLRNEINDPPKKDTLFIRCFLYSHGRERHLPHHLSRDTKERKKGKKKSKKYWLATDPHWLIEENTLTQPFFVLGSLADTNTTRLNTPSNCDKYDNNNNNDSNNYYHYYYYH